MGKSKFIDKRHAQTFSVVRRSQRDPLIADESSSPFVLVPVDNPKNRSSGDALRRVVQGQEAFFDHVPGRAAAGRPMHARTHRRPDEPDSDDDEDDAELALDEEGDGDGDASASDADADADADEAAVEATEKQPASSHAAAAKKHHRRANRNVGEAAKYGIYFDDTEYDYTQHLKVIGEDPSAVFIPAKEAGAAKRSARNNDLFGLLDDRASVAGSEAAPPDTEAVRARFNLPADVFASPFEEDVGLLNLAAPVTGPQPELDEDVREVLEALDDDAYEGELEDDFVLQLDDADSGDEAEAEGEWEDEGEDAGGDAARRLPAGRPPLAQQPPARGRGQPEDDDGGEYYDSDDLDDTSTLDGGRRGGVRGGSASMFSMTSSVLPRTEILQVLDDRFERVMDQYDDFEIGELDPDDPEVAGTQSLDRYNEVFDKFLEKHTENTGKLIDILDRPKEHRAADATAEARPKKSEPSQRGSAGGGSDAASVAGSYASLTGRMTVLVRGDAPRRENWDCESVLSTYSNVYNRPAVIREPAPGRPQIRVGKSGMPLGVLDKGKDKAARTANDRVREYEQSRRAAGAAGDDDGDDEDGPAGSDSGGGSDGDEDDDGATATTATNAGVRRPKGETAEQRRARKQAIKEQRRERREAKKATKLAFKSEQLRQEREHMSSRKDAAAVAVRL